MKIKHFFLFFTLLASLSASAYSFSAVNEDGVTIYYNYGSGPSLSVAAGYYSGVVNIPESVIPPSSISYVPYWVESIDEAAFKGCSELTSVTIPDEVTSIGKEAFKDCTSLISVNIPHRVTSIGNSTFEDCSSLTTITIPESVTEIGENAFKGCHRLKAFYGKGASEDNRCLISNGTLRIASVYFTTDGTLFAFAPSGLTSYTIPYEAKAIFPAVFANCTDLISVTIPETVTNIPLCAFMGCSNLTSVSIGNGVNSIGYAAFSGCSKLTFVTIPEGVTQIIEEAFFNCNAITTVNFNATNCTLMGSSSSPIFKDCPKLTTLKIGDNVHNIPDYAFSGCVGLTSVSIPESVTTIGNYAFSDCTELKSALIGEPVNSNEQENPRGRDGMKVVSKGELVTTIGNSAFKNCGVLTSVSIGESINSIGTDAFSGCSNLKTVINYSALDITKGSTEYGGIATNADEVISGVRATSLMLSAESLELQKGGGTETLTATVLPSNATETIVWKTSDPEVATVDQNGTVTPVANGTATITATCGIHSQNCAVEVKTATAIDTLSADEDGREVEVYDLRGVKVADKELAPGIYIRRVGNKVEKVLVR